MAQVNMPNVRPPDDALTAIMKGLSIASQIYGLKTNMAEMEEYQRKQTAAQNLAEGKYDKNQQLMLSERLDVSEQEPVGGKFQKGADLSSGSPLYLSLKRDSSPLPKEIAGVKNGVAGTFLIDAKTNKEIGFYPSKPEKPSKPEPVRTREMEYVNPQGVAVKGLVADVPGKEFPLVPKEKPKPSKEQFDAALYGRRVEAASSVLDDLAESGYNRASYTEGLKAFLPNSTYNSQLKQQAQAERNFLNAILRRESGAAISPSEFESGEVQYFPRAGDDAEVLVQKEQNRRQAMEGLRAAAGDAWEKVPLVAKKRTEKDTSDEALAGPPPPPPPKIGEERRGHIFTGGDPSLPENWRKK